jgi:hypothetical protein
MTKNVERTTNYLNDKSNNFFDYESMTGWHLNPSRRLLCISLPFPYRNKKTNHITLTNKKNQPCFSTPTFKFNSHHEGNNKLSIRYQSILQSLSSLFPTIHSFIQLVSFPQTLIFNFFHILSLYSFVFQYIIQYCSLTFHNLTISY